MQTALLILGITVLIIAVDIAYNNGLALFKNTRAHRLLSDSHARFSEKVSLCKLLGHLKMLSKESCPYCSTMNMRRSHRYSFEKTVSIFGLWPYRCVHCKARFLKKLGRHFNNADHPTRGVSA
jgi:transposase-like protein